MDYYKKIMEEQNKEEKIDEAKRKLWEKIYILQEEKNLILMKRKKDGKMFWFSPVEKDDEDILEGFAERLKTDEIIKRATYIVEENDTVFVEIGTPTHKERFRWNPFLIIGLKKLLERAKNKEA